MPLPQGAGKIFQDNPARGMEFSEDLCYDVKVFLLLGKPDQKEVIALPSQVTNYQCPACTGPLQFDPQSGRLICEYCGSNYDPKEIEAQYAKKEAEAQAAKKKADAQYAQAVASMPEGSPWTEAEANGLKVYNCPSCGAEIICEETTAATSCVYCGNPSVVPGQLGGSLKPDFIIPFKKTKEEALAALKGFYKGKPLLPKAFSQTSHLEEVKGLYVPFWLYDGKAEGNAMYNASNSRSWTEGSYRVTETEYFEVGRGGSLDFHLIPADGSSSMGDDYMDSIEPFDYNGLLPFSTSYLPGFLADKYDVDAKASLPRVAERAKQSLMDAFSSTVTGYGSVSLREGRADFYPSRASYAMLPVWMLHTKWQNKDYYFTMNGQTGKLVGDLPVSKGRFWGIFAGVWAAVFAVIEVLTRLL